MLTVLILTRLVARFGTEALAGYGIGARLEFLLVPIVFAVGVASVPMVGMAIGARDVARARRVAWTAAARRRRCRSALIGLLVAWLPTCGRGCSRSDAGVRAAADLYLRLAGPAFAFVGLGLALYFASQGSGKVLGPVLASTVRLAVIAVGGWLLAAIGAPLWTLFALVAVSMVAYGLSTAAAVYITSGDRAISEAPVSGLHSLLRPAALMVSADQACKRLQPGTHAAARPACSIPARTRA